MENLKQDFIEKKDGCVYFFKHNNFKPIKIGYSTNESPLDRFEQFKTYSPFGAQIIGYIKTKKPYELEQQLHKKYETKRLNGEWFDISIEDVDNEILLNSTETENALRSDFYINYIKSKTHKVDVIYRYYDDNIVEFLNSSDLQFKKHRITFRKQFLSKFPNKYYSAQKFNKDVKTYCLLRNIPFAEEKCNGTMYFSFNNQ